MKSQKSSVPPVNFDNSQSSFEPPAPYTHEDHANACRSAALTGETLIGRFVQANYAGRGQCSRIRSAWITAEGRQMWSLTFAGPDVVGHGSWPVHKVAPCQGVDGRCVCAGEVPPLPGLLDPELGFAL